MAQDFGQGYDTRGAVQDPYQNVQNSGLNLADEQGGRISRVREPDMSGVGQPMKDLTGLLAQGSSLMNDYLEKKKDQWRVEGQLAYAQGKTQDELNANGQNPYTTQGFQAMQATTALDTWKTQKLLDIENGDNAKDPTQFSQSLSQGFGSITKGIQDPAIRKLIAAHAETALPEVLSAQMKAHASYVTDQNIKSAMGALASAADGAKLDPSLNPSGQKNLEERIAVITSTLKPDDAAQVLSQVAKAGIESGNTKLLNTLLGNQETNPNLKVKATIDANTIFARMIQQESKGKQFASDGTPLTSSAGAVGVAQLLPSTAEYAAGKAGIEWDNNKFRTDIDYNMKVGGAYYSQLLKQFNNNQTLATAAYNAGPGNVNSWIRRNGDPRSGMISDQEWASKIPVSETKNYVHSTMGDAFSTQQQLSTDHPLFSTLLNADGNRPAFTMAQVTGIHNALKEAMHQEGDKYDKQKFLDEAAIKDHAEGNGNLSESWDFAQGLAQQHGYDDKWLNEQKGIINSGIATYQKEAEHTATLTSAIAKNDIKSLSTADQKEAFDLGRAQDQAKVQQLYQTGAFNDDAKKQNTTPEELRGKALIQASLERMSANGIVDPVVASQFQTDIANLKNMKQSDLIDSKTGGLSPQGQKYSDMVGMYYQLSQMKGSSPELAKKLTEGSTDSTLMMNEILGNQSAGSNLVDAITLANGYLNHPEGMRHEDVAEEQIKSGIDTYADRNLKGSIYNMVFGGEAHAGPFDVSGKEVEAWKNDPMLNGVIHTIANQYYHNYPQSSPAGAVQEAISQVRSQGDFAGGSFLFAPKGQTVKGMMGLDNRSDPFITHQAIMHAMETFGPKTNMWGNEYNNIQIMGHPDRDSYQKGFMATLATTPASAISGEAITQSIADKWRGVPQATYRINPDTQTLIITPYQNKEGTLMYNQPREIPLKMIGDLWKHDHPDSSTSYWNQGLNAIKTGVGNAAQALGTEEHNLIDQYLPK